MSETVTLYRSEPRDFRGNESRVNFERVGEFRKVSWCKTHDAEWCTFFFEQGGIRYDDSDGCWRGAFDGGMPRNGSSFIDDECLLVELWMEVR